MRLTLPTYLVDLAAIAGARRRVLAIHDSRPTVYGDPAGELWGVDIESAGAELVVAMYLNQFWTPWARRPADVDADVGTDVQVRWSKRENASLILHDRDPDDHIAVLVTGSLPTYDLVGWAAIGLAKTEHPVGDPFGTGRPAHWVPQSFLTPIEHLRDPEPVIA